MAEAMAEAMRAARWPGHRARWAAAVALLLAAPVLWPGSFGLTLASQVGIAVIACGACRLLLGQGGMLSFGQAVYSGLGAYLALHTLQRIGAGAWPLPVSLVPLAGGLGGAGSAALLGWLATRHSGTAFAMVTLGLGELVWALALMLPEVFGGEGGLAANRVAGPAVAGITFGPAGEVYGLVAAYALACTAALQGLTRTPLGRWLNAVRDNAERVAFLGPDPRQVRWRAFVIAGFFAGVAGGLSALTFEQVSAEALGAPRSATLLLFVVLGGTGHAAGPVLAALLMVLAPALLSGLTPAWLLYLGLLFMAMVVALPGGLASLLVPATRPLAGRPRRRLAGPAAALALAVLALVAGAVALVEMAYRLRLDAALRPAWAAAGQPLDIGRPAPWLGALAWLGVAAGLVVWRRRAWAAARAASAPATARPAELADELADELAAELAAELADEPAAEPAARMAGAVAAPVAAPAAASPAPAERAGPAADTHVALDLRGLRQRFGATAVLRGVDLQLRTGERLALIGPNGAGKTTLFNLVSGRLRPSRGTVWLQGRRIDGLAPQQVRRRGLSRSFQVSSLFPGLSVFEHLRCALLWDGGAGYSAWRPLSRLQAVNARAEQLLCLLHLQHRRDALAQQLGHAEQRTLEIGLAIAGDAAVVLLDEPSAGLSQSETQRLVPLIRTLTAGRTLLLVEHDMGVVFGLADRVAVLADGRLIACDTPAAVRADPRVQQAYLGDPAALPAPAGAPDHG